MKKKSIFKYFIILLSAVIMNSCGEEDTGQIVDRRVPNTNNFEVISSGYLHTCGIDNFTTPGQLKCWGSNVYGQLGNGLQTDSLTPQIIDASQSYKKVVLGIEHTCGITTSDQIKCWGRNNFGQLGTGNNTDALIPVGIDNSVQYSEISASGKSNCAITIAGLLKCWGYNGFGVLGDGTALNRNVPVVVDALVIYKSISVGELHTCGITSTDALKCWGNNDFYELGDGTTTTRFLPVLIDSSTSYKKIATSKIASYHTCGITSANQLKCWGNNQYGQLGDGTQTNRPLPVIINSNISYNDISLGYVHTCATESSTQKLFCWGKNDFGQLGDYTTLQSLIPIEADTGQKIIKLSAGYNYTCGVTSENFLRCYGSNTQGQIGDGTTIDVFIPKIIN